MVSTSTFFFCKMLKKSPAFVPVANIAHNSVPKMKLYRASLSYISQVRHFRNVCLSGNGSMRRGFASVACAATDSGPAEEHSALDTVLKLYEAIKNKNVSEISDIIAEECLCVSNFVSGFQPFHGKKQVLAFFSTLMKNLGNNIEFVVQQTSDDGMVVAVSWKLEWNEVPLPLGKGFGFYMYHVYQGKECGDFHGATASHRTPEIGESPDFSKLRLSFFLFIKTTTFTGHLYSISGQKVITLVMTAMEKINLQARFRNKVTRRAIVILFILLSAAAIVFLLRYRVTT
ncbi:UNVERIFIED_CONTAM: hypothetical protein Sradi_2228400 [Sesamum radiatum]|uniref:Nuclear transport factor 2 domain-containing protein n=1 Tax=Sesamum radiatum TaxID=300843 RepID=A0AAW2T5D8_SESRA